MKRLSPSMAVSLLALFVALGGTGYAAAKLNGRNIVNRSIAGTKLQRNTLSGAQIRESGLAKVPAAEDADFLAGRPPGAYVLAGTGVAANSLRLGGREASAFLPVGGTAANAALLGGNPASAFLPAGGTAANSALLGGKSAADFVAATRLQGAGPVAIAMPATGETATTLATNGALTLVGVCANSGNSPAGRVEVRNAGTTAFVTVGNGPGGSVADGSATPVISAVSSGPGATNGGGFSFSAIAGSAALQGAATAIVANGAAKGCTFAAWAFAS